MNYFDQLVLFLFTSNRYVTQTYHTKKSIKHRGFTMIEIIMVIVIISAISVVAGPRFFSISDFEERQAFDELFLAVQSAQRYAIATGCLVQLDISSTTFHITKDAECFTSLAADFNKTGFNNEIWHLGEQQMGYQYTAPSGVSAFVTPTNPILFNGRGQPLDSSLNALSTTTITMGGRSIVIERDTGYVH